MEGKRHDHYHNGVRDVVGAEEKYIGHALELSLHCSSGPVFIQGGHCPPHVRKFCCPADITQPEEATEVRSPSLGEYHCLILWCRIWGQSLQQLERFL